MTIEPHFSNSGSVPCKPRPGLAGQLRADAPPQRHRDTEKELTKGRRVAAKVWGWLKAACRRLQVRMVLRVARVEAGFWWKFVRVGVGIGLLLGSCSRMNRWVGQAVEEGTHHRGTETQR